MIGYTRGGSPIFFESAPRPKNRTTGQRNKRFACKACPAKTTKNQLKLNGGVCHACKAPIARPNVDQKNDYLSRQNPIQELARAIEAAKDEALGGKVMIPLEVAETILALVKR